MGWAGGGWIGYETGWFYDAVRFGVVGYTSQPPVAPPGMPRARSCCRPGPARLHGALGQAWGKLKLWGQEFTGYRQLINQPEVNPQDNRMTPATFEAYTLGGQLGGFSYFAGYVAKEKTAQQRWSSTHGEGGGSPRQRQRGYGTSRRGLTFAPDDSFKARLSGLSCAQHP